MTIRVNAWLIERSDQLQPIPPRDIEDIQAPEGGGMGWWVIAHDFCVKTKYFEWFWWVIAHDF